MSDINIDTPNELHVCMGLNDCKNLGYSGNNACAGQGDCATVTHACHTLNECKGQGGCGLFGTTKEFCTPSENECKYQGSCGSPILASRFIVQGPNKKQSVWQLARQRFIEKRKAQGKNYGEIPADFPQYGPTNDFVNTIRKQTAGRNNESCGQSGSRFCSYAPDAATRKAEATQRVEAMEKASAQDMPETLKNCD